MDKIDIMDSFNRAAKGGDTVFLRLYRSIKQHKSEGKKYLEYLESLKFQDETELLTEVLLANEHLKLE